MQETIISIAIALYSLAHVIVLIYVIAKVHSNNRSVLKGGR